MPAELIDQLLELLKDPGTEKIEAVDASQCSPHRQPDRSPALFTLDLLSRNYQENIQNSPQPDGDLPNLDCATNPFSAPNSPATPHHTAPRVRPPTAPPRPSRPSLRRPSPPSASRGASPCRSGELHRGRRFRDGGRNKELRWHIVQSVWRLDFRALFCAQIP